MLRSGAKLTLAYYWEVSLGTNKAETEAIATFSHNITFDRVVKILIYFNKMIDSAIPIIYAECLINTVRSDRLYGSSSRRDCDYPMGE